MLKKSPQEVSQVLSRNETHWVISNAQMPTLCEYLNGNNPDGALFCIVESDNSICITRTIKGPFTNELIDRHHVIHGRNLKGGHRISLRVSKHPADGSPTGTVQINTSTPPDWHTPKLGVMNAMIPRQP